MAKRTPKPMMIGEVEDMITAMSETADVLGFPQEWFEDHLISTAHMRGREVSRYTVQSAIDFWRQDYLEKLRWQQIYAKLDRAAQQGLAPDALSGAVI